MRDDSRKQSREQETETGDGEKPREGGQMAIITVDAYGLILPESLRIACGKDGTL